MFLVLDQGCGVWFALERWGIVELSPLYPLSKSAHLILTSAVSNLFPDLLFVRMKPSDDVYKLVCASFRHETLDGKNMDHGPRKARRSLCVKKNGGAHSLLATAERDRWRRGAEGRWGEEGGRKGESFMLFHLKEFQVSRHRPESFFEKYSGRTENVQRHTLPPADSFVARATLVKATAFSSWAKGRLVGLKHLRQHTYYSPRHIMSSCQPASQSGEGTLPAAKGCRLYGSKETTPRMYLQQQRSLVS